MERILSYDKFQKLFEGGNAIKQARRIKESEVDSTLKSIKSLLIPLIGGGEIGKEYILIGSAGKKKDPDDSSGDLDLGIDSSFVASKYKVNTEDLLSSLNKELLEKLPKQLGFTPDMKLMKGINVLSIGWPINGDESNGIVQLDLIPISDIEWAKFIFYSPDYKKNESKYKSAHRNWLFQAILSSMKDIESRDANGDIENFSTYALRLSDGIYLNKKTFKGIRKKLLKAKTIPGESKFITRDPQKLIEMLFGKGISASNIKSFEDAWELVSAKNFKHRDKIDDIKKDLVRYLDNGGYEIPTEIK